MISDTGEILYAAWKGYADRFHTHFEPAHTDLRFSCAGIPSALFNCAYPRRAIGRGELLRLMKDFSGILSRYGVPGILIVQVGRADLPPDIKPVLRMPGMMARELAKPKHPPAAIEVHHAQGEKMAEELARLNVVSHGMPLREIRPMTCAALWQPPNHGFVIYADGQAAACGSASFVNGASYVGWMATLEPYRGRGYAEAILRFADDFMRREYGVKQSILHATDRGRPVYERLGYRVLDEFAGYLCGATA